MSLWHRYPVFRAFLAFTAGILFANFSATSLTLFAGLLILGFAFSIICGFQKEVFFSYRHRWWFGFAVSLALFSLGVVISHLHSQKLSPGYLTSVPDGNQFYWVQLKEDPREKENSFGARARLLGTESSTYATDIMLYLQKDEAASGLRYGDRLLVKAWLNELTPPKNPYEFDYRNYLNLKAIYYQAYVKSSDWKHISKGHGSAILSIAKKMRRKMLSLIDRWPIASEEKAITKALLLGYRYDIDEDHLKAYASAGAMHVLAVSGLHVGIVYLMAFYALYFLTKIRHGSVIRMGILILLLWFYACLTGLSASVVRASTMFTFVAIGSSFQRSTSVYNTILGSVMLLLLIRPTYLFEVGFQLSYAAVFGIVWLQPKLESLWQPRGWLLEKVWAITTVSLAAQLATFPLGLYYFHQFPSLFLLSNLMVIPLVTGLMYLGLGTLLICLSGYIPVFLVKIYDFFLSLMNLGVNWVEQQAFLLIDQIHITRLELVLLYFIILTGCTWIFYGGYRKLSLTLIAIVFFSCSLLFEKFELKNQGQLVTYSVRNHAVVGIYGPGGNFFLSDTIFIENEDALTFHVKHHWWARDLRNLQTLGFHEDFDSPFTAKHGNLLQFGNDRILLYSQKWQRLPTADLWIVVSGISPPEAPGPLPRQVILSGKLDYYNQQEWLRWCQKHKVKVWNTLKKGAWVQNSSQPKNLLAGIFK